MRDSPWFFPVITLSAIVWSYGLAYTAYEAGYKRASVEAAEQQQYVNRKMDEIGFCAWVEQSEFVQYCQGRAALNKEGQSDG